MMDTPILYPGDCVHVFMPIGNALPEESEVMQQQLRTVYQAKGVTVLLTTIADGHSTGGPHVVAVFRANR